MKPRQFLIRNSDRGIWNYGVLLRWNILMMGRLSGLPIFILTNYNLAVRVPLTAIPNRESRGTRPPCESRAAPSSPSGETSARSAATLRAGAQSKRQKSAKGVWGKTRVFPHKQHIKSSHDYPPKQSGGLFRKHTTPLNSSLSFQQSFHKLFF